MYIYQTAPNRLFPFLVPYIIGLIPRACQLREVFSPIENSDKRNLVLVYIYRICNLHPYKQIPRIMSQSNIDLLDQTPDALNAWFGWYKTYNNYDMEIEFLYGTFPGKILNNLPKKPYDFSFTFLDHPINQLQNIFAYIKKEFWNHNKVISIGLDQSHNTIPEHRLEFRDYLYIEIYQKFGSYEKFVDAFINNGGYINLEIFNIKYQLPPEDIGRYASHAYKHHDLYGILDDPKLLDKSFRVLKEVGRMKDIPNDPIDRYKKPSKITNLSEYRIEELSKILKDDIDFFMTKKSELNKI